MAQTNKQGFPLTLESDMFEFCCKKEVALLRTDLAWDTTHIAWKWLLYTHEMVLRDRCELGVRVKEKSETSFSIPMTRAVADSAACPIFMEDILQKPCRIPLAVQREFHMTNHMT